MKFIDLHCDTISAIYESGRAGRARLLRRNEGHVDIERLKLGGCLAQSFALFTNIRKEPDPYTYVSELLGVFEEEMKRNEDEIKPALTIRDLRDQEKNGGMSAVLTIEEGAACRGSTELLREFYKKGVRMLTLTWNHENELGYPNRIDWNTGRCVPETERGLKPKGVEFIERMEELGMAVDVSHLGDAGFWDVVKTAKKPFAASHSNARAIAPHVRNLSDDMIRALSGRGGVIGINFCPAFLSEAENRKQQGAKSRISDMVRHIRHIRNTGGIDCLALGSDFDGIPGELELNSPAAMPLLEEELRRQGFKEEEIEKIFWKNALRFFEDVWG